MGDLTSFDDQHIQENAQDINHVGRSHYVSWVPVPEWYVEVVMGLYVPERIHSHEELRRRIAGMSEASRNAVVLLYSLSGSEIVRSARELEFHKYVSIMVRVWAELESTSLVTVCHSCPLAMYCQYPSRIFSHSRNIRKQISQIHNFVTMSGIQAKACLILRDQGSHKDSPGMSRDNSKVTEPPGDQSIIDCLKDNLEVALDVSRGENWKHLKGAEAGREKANAEYRIDPLSLVKIPSADNMLRAIVLHKKGRAMVAAAGLLTERFNPRSSLNPEEAGFSQPDRIIEKLIDLSKLALPKPVLLKTIVDDTDEVVPLYRDRSRTPVFLSVYLDVSGSMSNDRDNLGTAVSVTCALLQVFAPYGTVRVLPFDTEPMKTYEYVFTNDKQASNSWLQKLVGRRKYELIPCGGGTDITRLLRSEIRRGVTHPSHINYMCLVTDAEDTIPLTDAEDFRAFLIQNKVSFNTIHIRNDAKHRTISEMASQTVEVLQSFGTYIQTSQIGFETDCVEILKTIATNYRRAL